MSFNVFTDGGARGNGKGSSSWAFAVYDESEKYLGGKSKGFTEGTGLTNNQMELTAMLEALRWVEKASTEAIIYTDSAYVCNGINDWSKGWVRNGWKTANKGAVKNVELWKLVIELINTLGSSVTVLKVAGHDPSNTFKAIGNRQADTLCNVAMTEAEIAEL